MELSICGLAGITRVEVGGLGVAPARRALPFGPHHTYTREHPVPGSVTSIIARNDRAATHLRRAEMLGQYRMSVSAWSNLADQRARYRYAILPICGRLR